MSTIRTVRFERLPAYDIRACYGCGDDACIPTVAWIDHVTGEVLYCSDGDVPSEDGLVYDPRQTELGLDDAAVLLAWLDTPLLNEEFDALDAEYDQPDSWLARHYSR